MANEIIKNDNTINLSVSAVTGATNYQFQVSKAYLDFRSTLEYDNTANSTTRTFTASGNAKYYWKFRPYISSWQPWREVNSFIINTSASTDVAATSWQFISKSDVTDVYVLENQPLQKRIEPLHLWEAFRRNRAGDLTSEHYKTKYAITLDITRSYLGNNQKAEIMRFFNAHTSFYLAVRYDNQTEDDYIYRCFEVMLEPAPQLDIPGGNILEFTEV